MLENGYPGHARQIEFFGFNGGQLIERNTLRTDGGGGIGPTWGMYVAAQLNQRTP
jgi:hypothetical protein